MFSLVYKVTTRKERERERVDNGRTNSGGAIKQIIIPRVKLKQEFTVMKINP